jgi:hypothetical protein
LSTGVDTKAKIPNPVEKLETYKKEKKQVLLLLGSGTVVGLLYAKSFTVGGFPRPRLKSTLLVDYKKIKDYDIFQ